MSVNGTLVEDKLRRFKGECAHFNFNKCLIYTHDGASANYSANSQETDNSVLYEESLQCKTVEPFPCPGFLYSNISIAFLIPLFYLYCTPLHFYFCRYIPYSPLYSGLLPFPSLAVRGLQRDVSILTDQ